MGESDTDVRVAAFNRLRTLALMYGGALPWSAIADGFISRERTFLFASAAEGIFRPAGMKGILSLKTVVPKPKGRIWYHDQSPSETGSSQDIFWYAFRGSDPGNSRNQWLRDAMREKLPLVYFYGVAPGLYEPLFPTFIVDWDPERLSCGLSFSDENIRGGTWSVPEESQRRYAVRTVKQRLHQAVFRARVLDAYGWRCALSGLPEARLVDAAHIMPDADEYLGQPIINNGICMSKIHHAAYDAGLIGIDADLRIHVSEHLLAIHDGPMLEQGLKALKGNLIRIPDDPFAAPDRERLSARFELFNA